MSGAEGTVDMVLDARIERLQASLDRANQLGAGWAAKAQKHIDDTNNNWDKLFGRTDPGKALDSVFSSTRLKVLDSGVARVGLFGSAIEELGPIGLVAAAGIGALFVTMEQTDKAIEAAASIGKLAKETGTTTDFIQEFNFALRQSDIDIGGGDQALKALNATLGSVQGNLPRAKQLAVVFADALKISPDQLRGYTDVGQLLPVLADRIKAAGSAAEQAAIAKKFGVEDLLPLLRQGGDAFNKLAAEAKDLGVVLDHDLIEKAEDAKKKLAEIADVTKAKATATFAEFADTLLAVKSAFAQAELAGLKFLASLTNTVPLAEKLKDLQEKRDSLIADNRKSGLIDNTPRVASLNKEIGLLQLIQANDARNGARTDATGAARQFIPDKVKTTKTKTDRTQEAIDDSLAKEDAAHASLLEALLAQSTELDQQLAYTREITQAEKDRVDASTAKKIAEVESAKDIKSTAKQGIEATLLIAAEEQKRALDEKAIREVVALQLAQAKKLVDQQNAHLDAEAGIFDAQAQLATTLKERAALEQKALALRQEAERKTASLAIDEAIAKGDFTGIVGAVQAHSDLLKTQGAQSAALNVQNAGPVSQYLRSVQDLDTEFQSAGVHAIQSLSSGLADAIVNAKSLGDVGRSVFRTLIADLLQAVFQKQIGGAVASAFGLPGFASGTDFAPGGAAIVGEHGPEIVNLPRGAQVLSNSNLTALSNMTVPPRQSGGGVQVFNFDNRGAVMTQDLIDQMNQIGARAAAAGGQNGYDRTMARLARRQANVLGR